jgi:energy-coupling factor transport system ATP-binding protein
VIELSQVSFRYSPHGKAIFEDMNVEVPDNSLALVTGPTGAGKSTLLGLLNSHVPSFTGGQVSGQVRVCGVDVLASRPRDLAQIVGVVPQSPRSCFIADTVETEIAFALEQIGLDDTSMRKRVEEVIDLMGLQHLRSRRLSRLSGGEAQRVAIGAVLVAHPKVLILDEPTSALDPVATEEVIAALKRLVDDLGMTVVLSEHRLERVSESADLVIALDSSTGAPKVGTPQDVFQSSEIVPPLVQLGRSANWQPLPITIRDGRRHAQSQLRPALERKALITQAPPRATQKHREATNESIASVTKLRVDYQSNRALEETTLVFQPGEVTAVMGRNGSGKTTLLSCLVGLIDPTAGVVQVAGLAPAGLTGKARISRVGLVPSEPADLFFGESVKDECEASDVDANLASGTTRAVLAELATEIQQDDHPRDLSEGQQLCLALAITCAANPQVLLMDEPTRGLDYPSKQRLAGILLRLRANGRSLIIATHDVEFVATIADRVVVLAQGDVVADDDSRTVLTSSPMFAPQMKKIFPDQDWLTVSEALAGLTVSA